MNLQNEKSLNQEKLNQNMERLGFIDGKPTPAQRQFINHVDHEIFRFLGTIHALYMDAMDVEYEDMEWDIEKINEIRKKVEEVLNLPDIY